MKYAVMSTDVEGRYQTPYTAQCNGVFRHGAQFGDLPVFADHTRKSKMGSRSLCAARLLACDCFHAQLTVHAINLRT